MRLRPFILHCDTGRDDALTIWLALNLGLPLRAVVASYGNTTVKNAADNTARVLALAGRGDIPVFAGSSVPSREHKAFGAIVQPRQKAAGNGLCNLELPPAGTPGAMDAATMAARVAAIAEKEGALDYILLGPATDLAAMCAVWGADAPRYIARVTMMGGKPPELWEKIPGADFNILCDPFALRAVLASGLPVRFSTMRTTWPVMLPLDELKKLEPKTPLAATAKDLMIAHARQFSPEPVFRFHDPAALLAAMDEGNFKDVPVDIVCDDSSPDFGRIVDKEDGYRAAIHAPKPGHAEAFLKTILNGLGF